MARRLKVTGFTRFFLFLLIVTPTIFFGVTYFRGVDGVQLLKDMVNGDFSSLETSQNSQQETAPASAPAKEPVAPPPSKSQINGEVAKLQDELDYKDKKIEELYQENAGLKEELGKKEKELEQVKEQLEKIRAAIGNQNQ